MARQKKFREFFTSVQFLAVFVFLCACLLGYGGFFAVSLVSSYFAGAIDYAGGVAEVEEVFTPPPPVHIETPETVKAIYMTSWVAGTTDWRSSMVKMIEETELNALVIDVKDYTGRISFEVSDPVLKEYGAQEIRIPNIKGFIESLHEKNIYTIARISIFQDPYLVKKRPDLAVKTLSGEVWKDYKGITWLDPTNREVWDYMIRIAKESEMVGFDELNFDYIRFPSDGNMKDISYDHFDGTVPKAVAIRDFFEYLYFHLEDLGVPLSADLFGMTTTNSDDLNIGQILEYAAPYFDYIAPMVYPSHYPRGFLGYKNPAEYPYEVVNFAMVKGVEKLINASTSPLKLRPWIQDFDLGATYDASMVRKQIQATYDAGLTSWMLWSAANKYTRGALLEN
ncbi:MAG: putative glycoside hydrolase [Patescibacteria group bacterium]